MIVILCYMYYMNEDKLSLLNRKIRYIVCLYCRMSIPTLNIWCGRWFERTWWVLKGSRLLKKKGVQQHFINQSLDFTKTLSNYHTKYLYCYLQMTRSLVSVCFGCHRLSCGSMQYVWPGAVSGFLPGGGRDIFRGWQKNSALSLLSMFFAFLHNITN